MGYQKENNYDAIFLQETIYTAGSPYLILSTGKPNVYKLSKQSYGLWCGNFSFKCSKKCFQRGSLAQVARDHMERNANTREKTLVGSFYIPPGNENHLHILDMELEKHKDGNIFLIRDFNSRNKIWDRNANTEWVSYLKTLIDIAFT